MIKLPHSSTLMKCTMNDIHIGNNICLEYPFGSFILNMIPISELPLEYPSWTSILDSHLITSSWSFILDQIFVLELHLRNLFSDIFLDPPKDQGNQSRSVYFCLNLSNMALTLALAHGFNMETNLNLALAHGYRLSFLAMALDLAHGY